MKHILAFLLTIIKILYAAVSLVLLGICFMLLYGMAAEVLKKIF
jgi:ABC-type sulfate transport system permease subunit